MALEFRRGSTAIQQAAEKTTKGRSFLSQMIWKQDGEQKYVLVLTDMSEVATLLLHSFIPTGKGKKANGEEFIRYDEFLSRKDPAIGEDYDDLEDRLEREPKNRCIGVMVELDPITDGKKITGFVAKTDTFTRNTDDGEVEVTAPAIGFCVQSPITLWGTIDSAHKSLGDLTEVPLLITRRGKDQNTRYDLIPFQEKPVDLSPVIDHVDGISYISEEDLPGLLAEMDAAENEVACAQVVADYLLLKRLNELADGDRYKQLVSPLKLENMPNNPYGKKNKQATRRPARPERAPQRISEPEEPAAEVAEAKPPARSERFAALKSRVEAKA